MVNLYTYHSHEFKDTADWNAESAERAGFCVKRHELGELNADFETRGDDWMRLLNTKIDLVLDAILSEWGNVFVFADADVRFYGDAADDMKLLIGDHDIAFQCDWWKNETVCQGLWVARGNRATLDLFSRIKQMIGPHTDDQQATNVLIRSNIPLRWKMLPRRYWTVGADNGKRWSIGDDVNPPANIKAHHANWTVGHKNKVALLEAVNALC